ncbi:MAG: hypothetical protein WBW74_19145 [Xanthobacteraceae bacterium]
MHAAPQTFDKIRPDFGLEPAGEWSMAMADGKTQTPIDRCGHQLPAGASRLLNAAAWMEALAALEAEFQTILDRNPAADCGRGHQRPR